MAAAPTAVETSPLIGDGEVLQASTRLVVAPTDGTFEPAADLLGADPSPSVHRGQVVGYVTNGSQQVAITSPFTGWLETVMAWPAERVRKYQLVLALRLET